MLVSIYSYCVCTLIIIISDKDTIWNAAKYWEDKTCVSFVTKTDQVDYVYVKKSNGYVVAIVAVHADDTNSAALHLLYHFICCSECTHIIASSRSL